MTKSPTHNLLYYYLLGVILVFCENGHSAQKGIETVLEDTAKTQLLAPLEENGCKECSKTLPTLNELGSEQAVKALLQSSQEEKRLGQCCQSAFKIAKHFAVQGSNEAFQYYLLYHTLKGLDLFTKENLSLIENFALQKNEAARGLFVEAYGFGGRGRIEIDQSEQERTQKLIEQFASEGFKGAIEHLQYLQLFRMIEASKNVQ